MSRYEWRLYELRNEAAIAAAQAKKADRLIQKQFNRLQFLLALLPISTGLLLGAFDIQLNLKPLLWFVDAHARASSNPELTIFLLNSYLVLTPIQAILAHRAVAISLRGRRHTIFIQGLLLSCLILFVTLLPAIGGYKTKLSNDFQICWVLPLMYGVGLPGSITLLINSIVKIFVTEPDI